MTDSRHADYVRRAHEATARHSDALLAENERLRSQVALLDAAKGELDRRLEAADRAAAMVGPLRSLATRLEADNVALQGHLVELEDELAGARRDYAELRRRLESVENENRKAAEEHSEIIRRSAHLANLYVASYRLHETLHRPAVIEAIREIVVNLVGSEEFGVFELNESGDTLSLTDWCGDVVAGLPPKLSGASPILRTASIGEVYVGPAEPTRAAGEPAACIPLKVEGRVMGVIAVFRLLPHKPALEEVDLELFDLLAMQAGVALHCTRFRSTGASRPDAAAAQLTLDTSILGGNR